MTLVYLLTRLPLKGVTIKFVPDSPQSMGIVLKYQDKEVDFWLASHEMDRIIDLNEMLVSRIMSFCKNVGIEL